MSRPKVVVTDYPEPDLAWEAEQLAQRDIEFEAHQLGFAAKSDLIAAIQDADVIMTNHALMDAEVIHSLRRCRLILRHGVGYDNVDVSASTARGIRIGYYPDYCTEEVAEHAVTMMLACARRLGECRRIVQQSRQATEWDCSGFGSFRLIRGRTLGIIGCGRIGSWVYQLTASLGLNRIICDPYLPQQRLAELGIAQRFALDELLAESDFVTLHTPLNDETRHLIGERELGLMKPSAYLINTARGGIVDTPALIKALREGWLAGAALDVYEPEPPPADSELLRWDNVILSPHSAWRSEEAAHGIRLRILEDIYRCLDNQRPGFTANEQVEEVLGGRAYREVD